MRRTTAVLGLFVAFGLVACDSATSPAAPDSETPSAFDVMTVDEALTHNSHMGIERAEFRDGFCQVVLFEGVNFSLYTGASKAVATPSGNINYTCRGTLLFGPGAESVFRLDGVSFFDFSPDEGFAIISPCTLHLTPGASGQMTVKCHVTPREGEFVLI